MWWTQPMSVEVRAGRACGFVGEDGDQPPVAGIEIEMAFAGLVEIRLLEDEGHAEHAFPEIDRGLPVGADKRDVMDALGLKFLHAFLLDPARRTQC